MYRIIKLSTLVGGSWTHERDLSLKVAIERDPPRFVVMSGNTERTSVSLTREEVASKRVKALKKRDVVGLRYLDANSVPQKVQMRFLNEQDADSCSEELSKLIVMKDLAGNGPTQDVEFSQAPFEIERSPFKRPKVGIPESIQDVAASVLNLKPAVEPPKTVTDTEEALPDFDTDEGLEFWVKATLNCSKFTQDLKRIEAILLRESK